MMAHQYLLQQEQQRREETERQLYYTAASMEDMRRQLLDLQNAYQQQSVMLEHERQQRAVLFEQVKQQQAMLVEKERQKIHDERKRVSKEQQQLIQRVSDEVRRFHAANEFAPSDVYLASDSPLSREMSIVPSEIPAPNKYPHVDWSLHYSMARLEDMMEEPESSRNTLFYALLSFHVKRLEALNIDSACDDLIKRVNEELKKKQDVNF